jgi:large subunit ribosomal protein L1
MGKVKSAILGGTEEQAEKDKKKRQREEKKKREAASGEIHLSGTKGGEKSKVVGAQSEEEIEKMVKLARDSEEMEKSAESGEKEGKKKFEKKPHVRGKRYQEMLTKVEHGKVYGLSEAIKLLRGVHLAKFDESVEVHLNVSEKGLRGQVTLPHGTGKKVRVVIADTDTIDKLIANIEKGVIEFDALVAHPQVMGKLGKVARYLGPRGLMPNPKNGTISPTPEKVAKKLEGGEITWKTESEFPLIHQVVGKLSFKDDQIKENITELFKAIEVSKIKEATLKSTMSPGIKIQIN